MTKHDRASLQGELDALKASTSERFGADVAEKTERAHDQQVSSIRDSQLLETSLRVGDRAPDFALWDQYDRVVRLSTLLVDGPVVATFYRGGWCSYCRKELQAYHAALGEFTSKGATVIALSPESPAHTRATATDNDVTFSVLSDAANDVARRFGIVFAFSPELIENYLSMGRSLVDINGDEAWELPIPATLIIDQSGVIRFAHIDPDYTHRLDPTAVLGELRVLTGD